MQVTRSTQESGGVGGAGDGAEPGRLLARQTRRILRVPAPQIRALIEAELEDAGSGGRVSQLSPLASLGQLAATYLGAVDAVRDVERRWGSAPPKNRLLAQRAEDDLREAILGTSQAISPRPARRRSIVRRLAEAIGRAIARSTRSREARRGCP